MRSDRVPISEQSYHRGLDGLVAGETEVGEVDGVAGRLSYRGYDVADLAASCSFEQVSYLVLYGELPDPSELRGWTAELERWRALPPAALGALGYLPSSAHPLAQYRTMLTVASCEAPGVEQSGDDLRWGRPARILSWSAGLAAAAIRNLSGRRPVEPPSGLSHAESFLAQTLGSPPSSEAVRAFEVSLIVQAEHGLHAAALAALTVFSTGADLGSAVLAGMGALSGVRHGGANQLAFEALAGLEDPHQARRWAEEALARKHRFSGFGHRVYKCPDPRVTVLERHAEALLRSRGMAERWGVYQAVKETVEAALSSKGIYANVDSVTGLIYAPLGLPPSAFTIPFCLAIQSGWMAHCLEYQGGAMFEPGAVYAKASG